MNRKVSSSVGGMRVVITCLQPGMVSFEMPEKESGLEVLKI